MKKFIVLAIAIAIALSMVTVAFAAATAETPNAPAINTPATALTHTVVTNMTNDVTNDVVENDNDVIENIVLENKTTCDHTFEIHYDIPHYEHHYLKCSNCSEITTETHVWEITGNVELNSEYQHQVICTICKCVAGQDHVFENGICACGYEVHVCTIDRATENYHRYSCEECDNYSRVYHNEDTMNVLVKNEFFHTWECSCGYAYAEKHDFATSYNNEVHQEVCVDCGYEATAESHNMVNDFYGDYHDIQCDECGYMAEHHVGVKYETVDANNCQAVCRCGVVDTIEHDWDGFICDNCDYAMSGDTYAIVGRISKNDEGYRVRFIDNCGTHRIDMWDVTGFEEGDFVKINHSANDVFTITVIVDGDIVEDAENFHNYISDEIDEKPENVAFEDLVISEIFEYDDGNVVIVFDSYRRSMGFHSDNYVVYNLIDGDMGQLEEGYAYLTFVTGNTLYFVCFW